jgi:Glycosyl hydrolase family 26
MGRRQLAVGALWVAAVLVVGGGAYALGRGGGTQDTAHHRDAGKPVAPTVVVPDRTRFLDPTDGHKYFGVASPNAPWRSSVLTGIGKKAGVTPDLVEYFVNWTQKYDPDTVRAAYAQHALPVISWEPWAGSAKGTKQPAYSLGTIVDGKHDAYIRSFAEAVKANRWPVALRLGHEMNGHWYPWAEPNGVNKPGQYVAAWKHVVDIFRKVGATNVIWVWSPNILRGANPVSLHELYPGDSYVDWIGLSAYDVTETNASQVLDPTLRDIRGLTKRPLLITETGSQPGPQKAGWTASFFPWLRAHPDVIGFVWFQYTHAQGAGADWTFTSSPAAQSAFRKGVKTLSLEPVPGK